MDISPDIARRKYAFGEFVFDPRSGELLDGQKTALLRPQVAKLLALLLEHAGNIVSRDEIRHCLWGSHTVVEFEEGISACMRQLRVALNDGATGTRYIQTNKKAHLIGAPCVTVIYSPQSPIAKRQPAQQHGIPN